MTRSAVHRNQRKGRPVVRLRGGMDSRVPSRSRSLAMILVLIDGNEFTPSEEAEIRSHLARPRGPFEFERVVIATEDNRP